MKHWWKYLGVLIIGSVAAYYLTIALIPNIIYAGAKKKILSRPGTAINKLVVSPIVEASSRAVVMPNPDFIYLTSFYDLSEGPLSLSGDMPDSTYWSVAMYHPNTINWFVRNDMQFEEMNKDGNRKDIDLKIGFKTKEGFPFKSKEIIKSEKEKGFLLIRVLITDRTEEKVKEYQQILSKVKLEKV